MRTWMMITHLEDTESAAAIKRAYDFRFPSEVVIIVNASRTHCLGGWKTGAQAQEEKIAIKTNAVARMIDPQTMHPYKADHGAYPLDEFGVVVIKKVVVMRGPEAEGYPFLQRPFLVDLCLSAAYKNPHVGRDGALGMSHQTGALVKLKQTLRAAIKRAEGQARPYLVITAWGCGAFGNPPEEIADMMATTLADAEFRYAFAGIIVPANDDHNSFHGNLAVFSQRLRPIADEFNRDFVSNSWKAGPGLLFTREQNLRTQEIID